MFPATYFPAAYFAPRYFPQVGSGAVVVVPYPVCVRGADRRVVALAGADRLVVSVSGYTAGGSCGRSDVGIIEIDEDAVITQGQDAVWKVVLDAPTTGTSWRLTVAENPNHLADLTLPEFLMALPQPRFVDTTDWVAVFSTTATDATLHDPDGAGVVAMAIADTEADLLTGAGPGRFVLDVWCVDDGSERPCYGPVWLSVRPPARRP
jgi:hypothetical protein